MGVGRHAELDEILRGGAVLVARSSLCLVAGVGCAKLKGARGARHNDSLSTCHTRPQPTLSTRSPHRQSPPLPEASAHPVPVLRVKIARASAARRQGRGREARQTPPCRYAGWHAIRFFGRRGDRPVTPLEPRDANPRARGAALRVGLSAVMSTSGTRVPATPTRTKGCFDMLVARR